MAEMADVDATLSSTETESSAATIAQSEEDALLDDKEFVVEQQNVENTEMDMDKLLDEDFSNFSEAKEESLQQNGTNEEEPEEEPEEANGEEPEEPPPDEPMEVEESAMVPSVPSLEDDPSSPSNENSRDSDSTFHPPNEDSSSSEQIVVNGREDSLSPVDFSNQRADSEEIEAIDVPSGSRENIENAVENDDAERVRNEEGQMDADILIDNAEVQEENENDDEEIKIVENESDDEIQLVEDSTSGEVSSTSNVRRLKTDYRLEELASKVNLEDGTINGVKFVRGCRVPTALIVANLPRYAANCTSSVCMDARARLSTENTVLRRNREKIAIELGTYKGLRDTEVKLLADKITDQDKTIQQLRDELYRVKMDNDRLSKALRNSQLAKSSVSQIARKPLITPAPAIQSPRGGHFGSLALQNGQVIRRTAPVAQVPQIRQTPSSSRAPVPEFPILSKTAPPFIDRRGATRGSSNGKTIRLQVPLFSSRNVDPNSLMPHPTKYPSRQHDTTPKHHCRTSMEARTLPKPELACNSDVQDVVVCKKMSYTLKYDPYSFKSIEVYWYVESTAENDLQYNWELIFSGEPNDSGQTTIILSFDRQQNFGIEVVRLCAWLQSQGDGGKTYLVWPLTRHLHIGEVYNKAICITDHSDLQQISQVHLPHTVLPRFVFLLCVTG